MTDSHNDQPGRYEWWLTPVTAGLAVLALIIALGAIVISGAQGSDDVGGGSLVSTGETTFAVTLKEFSITPASVTVPPGKEITFNVSNAGTMAHDFSVGGTNGTKMIAPGTSATLKVNSVPAATSAWCTVPGHKEAGMVMSIAVEGGSGTADMNMSGAPGADTASAAKPTVDPNATPSDGWHARDPELKPAEAHNEHKITLHASENVLEIAPGVKQEMWTFNGAVPGPVLHGKVGDTFTVTLINDGKVGHSLDFHASQTAMDTNMRTIAPGESLVYKFTAEHSGIWMYHCGTAPVLHHIGNGMYGAVVIDPPDLAPVAHEYAFVQSELYFGTNGAPGSLDAMLADDWDAVVFNGYYNQYKLQPITSAKPGERVRIWVLDAGPSENSAFHIVGTQFDTVFKEGSYLVRKGNAEKGASQTMDLQPSQGGFVEFEFAEDGTYAMVTHKFSNASQGALAIWHVGKVPEAPADTPSGH